jgi:MFS transporter, putative metabolite:H+ symporter
LSVAPGAPGGEASPAPFSPYQKRLLAFLSVATFFEGYDFIALTQILPNFRADMGIGKDTAGAIVAFINVGSIVAYFLVRSADRLGRRRVLTVTIAGYTTMTFLSGLAPNPWVFAVLQMGARVFLVGEYATSMVIAAEEFPASRRGVAIGVVAAFSSLGAIVCAGLVPVLLKTPYGWRMVYFLAVIPLATVAYARRGLKETARFVDQGAQSSRSLLHVWKTPYRKRVVALGAVWFFAYIATQNAITFWKDFVVTERGFTDKEVGAMISVSAVVAMPLVFGMGKLLDVLGRRPAAALVFTLGAFGTWGCYTFHDRTALMLSVMLGIFSSSAFLPILNSLSTELFPTSIRAEGFAWANTLLGRVGYVLSPLVIGRLAQSLGWGPVIRSTAVFPIVTIALVYWLIPETRGRTLEETARL